MTPSTPDPDDDQQWLDLLAGRHVAEPDRRTAQEAAWMRAALLAYRGQAPAGVPAAPDERMARLLARARTAGLIPTPKAGGSVRASRPTWRWSIGAAALVATLALLVAPWALRPGPDPDGTAVMRGDTVQVRRVTDPAADRETVRAALQAAGLDSVPYQRLDRLGLDVELPPVLSPSQRESLTGLGLKPPTGPSLHVEFMAEGASP